MRLQPFPGDGCQHMFVGGVLTAAAIGVGDPDGVHADDMAEGVVGQGARPGWAERPRACRRVFSMDALDKLDPGVIRGHAGGKAIVVRSFGDVDHARKSVAVQVGSDGRA